MIPVTVDDLAANGLLGEAHPQVCWERSVETLTARKDDIAGLAVASDERIEAYLLYVMRERRDGDCVAPLVHRGRWSPSEATALSTPRARHEDLPVPEGPPGGDLEGVPGDARFPPRRRASTLRSEGAVRLGPRCKLGSNVKSYHDIVGDGGSRALEQVAEQRTRITDGLAGVRHLVYPGRRQTSWRRVLLAGTAVLLFALTSTASPA